jgi:hypothetical protein
VRPAIRIIFAPLFKRHKAEREDGTYLHGFAQGRTIQIDPRGTLLLDTMVHEMTHVRHPDWTEQMVRDHTKIRMKKMGWKEKARLLQLLGSARIEGEGE